MRVRLAFCLGGILWAHAAAAACGVDRWPVKMAADPDAALINQLALPMTIETLHGLTTVRPLPQERRVLPVETTTYAITATMVAYRVAPDSSIHMILADASGRTIAAYIPDPACATGSRFLDRIHEVRERFLRRFPVTESFVRTRAAMEVRGIGFFDFLQGQQGAAPNGLGLYPVIDIDFTPMPWPQEPPSPGARRRAVRTPIGCVPPSLTISATRRSVCSGETTTISWQASDPAATASIEGIGTSLPSAGSRTVTVGASTAWSGRATNACGTGYEAVAVVALSSGSSASLSGPASVKQGRTASINVTVAGVTSWTLTSSLGNPISPSTGTSSQAVQYTGTKTGNDVVTLRATGACGPLTRDLAINVAQDQQPPPPPPPSGGLLCCDGTRSPSCFDCGNKRGCCSGHDGVCGCPGFIDEEDVSLETPSVCPNEAL